MKCKIPLLQTLFVGGLLALLVLAPATPARAQGAPTGASQFWTSSVLGGGNIWVRNTTNDEYFSIALLYNHQGGWFQNCLGFLTPPHGASHVSEGSALGNGWEPGAWETSWELFAVPTETRTWDPTGTQGLGVYTHSKKTPHPAAPPPSQLAPPRTVPARLIAMACICEQVQCFEQANNVFGQLGINCAGAAPLDCDDRVSWGSTCPACVP